jgi:hypothetical protein
LSHSVTSIGKYTDHLFFPYFIIRFLIVFNTVIPDPGEKGIFRAESTNILDPSDPFSPMIKDKKPPATIIPTDLRPCLMHGAVRVPAVWLTAEKRTSLGKFFKNSLVLKEITLVRIDHYRCFFTGIIVIN